MSVRLQNVGKRYLRYNASSSRGSGELWALDDVSLSVEPGEALGVIGRNGSGKSTLLRLAAGVTRPTRGTVRTRGRVAPLLAVGVGFHRELTGRENIAVNGTVLGLSRGEITRRFDEIVDFAGIEPFLDTPVKFYSSGMFVRLGFAVAVLADPDVLLVDEVLAVGDLAFQAKCFERLEQIKAQGASILVVSHNLLAVQALCDRVAVLDTGRVQHDGEVETGLAVYHRLLGRTGSAEPFAGVTAVEILDVAGAAGGSIVSGDEVVVRVHTSASRTAPASVVELLVTADDLEVARTRMDVTEDAPAYDVVVRLPLATGSYQVRAAVVAPDAAPTLFPASAPVAHLRVSSGRPVHGVLDLHGALAAADGGDR